MQMPPQHQPPPHQPHPGLQMPHTGSPMSQQNPTSFSSGCLNAHTISHHCLSCPSTSPSFCSHTFLKYDQPHPGSQMPHTGSPMSPQNPTSISSGCLNAHTISHHCLSCPPTSPSFRSCTFLKYHQPHPSSQMPHTRSPMSP